VWGEVDSRRPGHLNHRTLAGLIREVALYGIHAEGRRDVDDRASAGAAHAARRCPHAEKDAGLIDGERLAPLLVGAVGNAAEADYACIVDQDVERPELSLGVADGGIPVPSAGDVQAPVDRLVAGVAQRLGAALALCVADVGQDDAGAFPT
jgi:hypothetical protein